MADQRGFYENDPNRAAPMLGKEYGGGVHMRVADLERTQTLKTAMTPIQGIGAGVAYAAEDAVGVPTGIVVPDRGIIMGALSYDTDDNELDFSILLFESAITPTDDNSAFLLAANDIPKLMGVITMDTFKSINGDVLGQVSNVNIPYSAPNKTLVMQVVTNGSPNFSAGTGLWVGLQIWTRSVL